MVKYVLVEVGVEFVGDFGLLLVVIVLFVLFESVLVPEQFVFLDFVVEELRQSLFLFHIWKLTLYDINLLLVMCVCVIL